MTHKKCWFSFQHKWQYIKSDTHTEYILGEQVIRNIYHIRRCKRCGKIEHYIGLVGWCNMAHEKQAVVEKKYLNGELIFDPTRN